MGLYFRLTTVNVNNIYQGYNPEKLPPEGLDPPSAHESFSELSPPLARRRLLSCPVLVLCTGQDVSLWKCLLRHQETTCHRMSPIAGSTGVGRLLLPSPQETGILLWSF